MAIDNDKTLKESLEDGTVDKDLLFKAFGEVMGAYRENTLEQSEGPAKKVVVGRNDPCPCGSGLKYKKCCGKNR